MQGTIELGRLPHICTTIGNEIADDDGFVPVRNLLQRFHAKLVVRPLLVEAMLASFSDGATGDNDQTRWAVLVDRETYPVSEEDVAEEARGKTLPPRFRNTVAHELVHSIAFRPSSFGLALRIDADKPSSEFVEAIERQTEKLSPLLLISDRALAKALEAKAVLSVDDLAHLAMIMGVSRDVLVSRFSLIPLGDPNRFRQTVAIRNLAIGVGEWIDERQAAIRSWPQFWNFDRNIAPSFLLGLARHDRVPMSSFCSDSGFEGCGGWRGTVDMDVPAGVTGAPDTHRMTIRLSMERADRKPRSSFIFTVQKLG